MPTVLSSREFAAAYGEEARAVAEKAGKTIEFVHPPQQAGARFTQAESDRIDCAFLDRETRFEEQLYTAFNEAVIASASIRWAHVSSSGAGQLPFVPALVKRGVIITTSTGANAEPVAQTGMTGLLMLARGFAGYVRNQQKHEWRELRGAALPNDLRGQTVLLIGVGAVGSRFTGYAQAFGLKVIGVRRSPRTPEDKVDELHPPSKLPELLPRADWIVLSCPLTKETENLIDADAFRRMKKGARLVNIARGEIVDEAALLTALRDGTLAGAALDAHRQEPLPADHPLWDMPNVIVSPHNASASNGNEKRVAEIFIDNMGRWLRGEKMRNVHGGK